MAHTQTCTRCGASFTAKRSDARYCSPRCRVAANRSQQQDPSPAREDTAMVNLFQVCHRAGRPLTMEQMTAQWLPRAIGFPNGARRAWRREVFGQAHDDLGGPKLPPDPVVFRWYTERVVGALVADGGLVPVGDGTYRVDPDRGPWVMSSVLVRQHRMVRWTPDFDVQAAADVAQAGLPGKLDSLLADPKLRLPRRVQAVLEQARRAFP